MKERREKAIALYVDKDPKFKQEFSWLYKTWVYHKLDKEYDLVVFHHPETDLSEFNGIVGIPFNFDGYRFADRYPFLKSHYFCLDETCRKHLRKYTYLLKTECDTFLTSKLKGFDPEHYVFVGVGDYCKQNTAKQIERVRKEMGLKYMSEDEILPMHNVGASFFAKTSTILLLVGNQAIITEGLLDGEFKDTEGSWEERWFKGTASMYAGEISLNMNFIYQGVIQGMLDGRCWNTPIPSHVLHIHAWHVSKGEGWSKRKFHEGLYKDRGVDHTQPPPRIASDYCHYFATMPMESLDRKISITAEDEMIYTFNGRGIVPHWSKNWGDMIPYIIVKTFSGSKNFSREKHFSVKNSKTDGKVISVGSVMNYTQPNDLVWGSGCIQPGSIGHTPKKVYAVRGPLTKNELKLRGIECPEVYGDPALLFPRIYSPKIEKKYKMGIIPHYIEFEDEKDVAVLKNLEQQGVKIIDICAGVTEFVDELLECEIVLSSSLHGLIAADAYKIPNARIIVSNKLIGGHFKFIDYCTSVGRQIDYGYQLTETTTLHDLLQLQYNKSIVFDPKLLLESSPWNDEVNNSLFT